MSSFVPKKDSSLAPILEAAAVGTYGYAIVWQSLSGKTLPMIVPALQMFGRWKFLTYQCLWIQFTTFSLMLAARKFPSLKRLSNYMFTVLAVPVGASVVITFWGVWFSMGREMMFPAKLDAIYPPWLNHVTHTIILPVNLMELYLSYHPAPNSKKALIGLTGFIGGYGALLLFVRYHTGYFVYPFLNQLDAFGVAAFLASTLALSTLYYKMGESLTKLFHVQDSSKKPLSRKTQ